MKQTATNPDFIKDNKRPEGFNRLTPAHINKASFNGDTYSWSSDNGGWFKDSPSTLPHLYLKEDEKFTHANELKVRKNEHRDIFEININEYNLNGTDLAEMTINHPVEYQKQMANEIVKRYNEYPTLYRENRELREALELLSKEVNISGLKLNVKNHFSLLNAKANADKLLHRISK